MGRESRIGLSSAYVALTMLHMPLWRSDTNISQTAQLRTHSLYAPYIDQDLQNRCVVLHMRLARLYLMENA